MTGVGQSSGYRVNRRSGVGAGAVAGAGVNGLGCCCCRVSVASRASRARRASAIRRRSRARCNARFLTALRSGLSRCPFVDDNGGAAERGDPGRRGVAFKPGTSGAGTAGAGRLQPEAPMFPQSQRRHFDIGNGGLGPDPSHRRLRNGFGRRSGRSLFHAQGGHLLGFCRSFLRSRLDRRARYLVQSPQLRRGEHRPVASRPRADRRAAGRGSASARR